MSSGTTTQHGAQPRRSSLLTNRGGRPSDAPVTGPPEQRTPSFLARMGIAPIDVGPKDPNRQFEVSDMPQRSPTGTVRAHGGSTLINRKVPSGLHKGEGGAKQVETIETGPQYQAMPLATFMEQVGALPDGHTADSASKGLLKYGPNELTQPPRMTLLERFLRNLLTAFSLIMIFAGILSFIVFAINTSMSGLDQQDLALALVLFAVAIITSTFQTLMENASEDLMAALHALVAAKAWVYRDGQLVEIDAKDIVPGDKVRVRAGEKVPADMRIIQATQLKVNNSPLTGESLEITLNPEPGLDKHGKAASVLEAKNIAFSGCNFTNGEGAGIIFATGDNTRFGKVAHAAVMAERPDTLMRREVARLILVMSALGVVFAAAFLGATLGLNMGWSLAIVLMIAAFVANIPEGLLPQITLALTVTAQRMADRQVLVSNLEIIETLGAVSVICSDKTGTLTLNRMSVSHILVGDGSGAEPYTTKYTPLMRGDVARPADVNSAGHKALMRCVALCSEASFTDRNAAKPADEWLVRGDATETGLVKYHQMFAGDLELARTTTKRLAWIPFSSSNKFMVSVNRVGPHKQVVLMKGAAERILKRCSKVAVDTPAAAGDQLQERPLDAAAAGTIDNQILGLANRAERVLGFAQLILDNPDDFEFDAESDIPNFPMTGMTFLGLCSLVDPIRPSVPKAVQDCRKAGIRAIMITGDHPATAVAIAKSLDLITLPEMPAEDQMPKSREPIVPPTKTTTDGDASAAAGVVAVATTTASDIDPELYERYAAVVTGEQMSKFTQHDWDRVMACGQQVFARTQPEQKQQIVYRLQERGHIVAMTGDGVNDSPALKAANVGVAVGSGTSVAKEAAHIVINDDDFSSIVVGIKEGRQIFENLKKAVVFVTAHLIPEMFAFIISFAANVPLGMDTINILLIDLGTDMAPGIALAWEEVEGRVMELPPRGPDDHLITTNMVMLGYVWIGLQETFFCWWAWFYTMYSFGYTWSTLTGGSGTDYRMNWGDMTPTDQTFFNGLCMSNSQYVHYKSAIGNATAVCGTSQAMDNFLGTWRSHCNHAEGAFYMTLAIFQFAHIFTRRQQVTSTFDIGPGWNWNIVWADIFSAAFMVFLVYTPVINDAFFMGPAYPGNALSGCWGIPIMIALEELRKWWCRKWPDGSVAYYMLF